VVVLGSFSSGVISFIRMFGRVIHPPVSVTMAEGYGIRFPAPKYQPAYVLRQTQLVITVTENIKWDSVIALS
jgi:hypothetical protein